MLESIDFDRFMTSEGTDTLISAFTSKSGQPVARYTHRFFIWIFLSVRRYIYAFYKPNFKLQTYRIREKELNKEDFFAFLIDF